MELVQWRVLELADGARVLAGMLPRRMTLRITSPITGNRRRRFTTTSGRVYHLVGAPASDVRMLFSIAEHLLLSGFDRARDVTREFEAVLEARDDVPTERGGVAVQSFWPSVGDPMQTVASESKTSVQMVFSDTEFTDLAAPRLLSLGAVTLDGREHYVELDLESDVGQQRLRRASIFVRSDGNVLAQWGRVQGAKATLPEMGRRTGEWLLAVARSSRPVDVLFDDPVDFELMAEAIRQSKLWHRVAEAVSVVHAGATLTEAGQQAAQDCYSRLAARRLFPHHALADAIALRAAYLAITNDAARLQRYVLGDGCKRLVATVRALLPGEMQSTFDVETRLRDWLMRRQPKLGHCRSLDVVQENGGEDRVDALLRR